MIIKLYVTCAFIVALLPVVIKAQPAWDTLGWYKKDAVKKAKATIPILKDKANGLVVFKADFDIDADGSPKAYNEENTGLLHNDNGRNKKTGKWFAVVTSDKAGKIPVKQQATDPAPGFYISTTSLPVAMYGLTDYRRYVNPDSVAYFVLPVRKNLGAPGGINNGDVGFVFNTKNARWSWAIFADAAGIVGEGSMKLARNIGIPVRIDAEGRLRGGMDEAGVVYITIPGSGLKKYTKLSDELVKQLCLKAIARLHITVGDLITLSKTL